MATNSKQTYNGKKNDALFEIFSFCDRLVKKEIALCMTLYAQWGLSQVCIKACSHEIDVNTL